jgi:cytochrome P450
LWALCFAGQEATAKMFGNAVYQAYCHNLDYILHKSPQLLDDFLVEVMRFDSPAQIIYRAALEDDIWHGVTLKKGARVALILGSASVDERAFGVDAGEFRVGRQAISDILTFGWGTHYCLGRHLGELEVKVCLQQFFERIRSYRLDMSQAIRVHTSTVHGFTKLPLEIIEFA